MTATKITTTPATAALLGDVATTTVQGSCTSCQMATNGLFPIGENIYGPYEAGFAAQQDFILEGLGCSPGSLGRLAGGIDTKTAEAMVAYQCNITLPRYDDGSYVSLLDECGGHTKEYHFHERLSCLYSSAVGSTHSPQIGVGQDGAGLFGKWEDYSQTLSPKLDVCGGHFGLTPESGSKKVYHYHVQENPPFTIGCYGPDYDSSGNMTLVSLAKCRDIYKDVTAQDGSKACGSGTQQVTTANGTITYDNWCPCYDATGSSVGNVELPVFDDAAAVTCTDSTCSKVALATPGSSATPAPTETVTTVTQVITIGLTSAEYTNAVATVYNLGYAKTLSLTNTLSTGALAFKTGVAVSSVASRRGASVTFTTSITGNAATLDATTVNAKVTSAALSTGISEVITANSISGVTAPSSSDLSTTSASVKTSTVTPSDGTSSAGIGAITAPFSAAAGLLVTLALVGAN